MRLTVPYVDLFARSLQLIMLTRRQCMQYPQFNHSGGGGGGGSMGRASSTASAGYIKANHGHYRSTPFGGSSASAPLLTCHLLSKTGGMRYMLCRTGGTRRACRCTLISLPCGKGSLECARAC